MKQHDPKRHGRKVSKKEVNELLASGKATLRNELRSTTADSFFDFYEMDDKQFLTVIEYSGTGIMWESYETMRNALQNTADRHKKLFPNAGLMGVAFKDMIVSDAKSFELLASESNEQLSGLLGIPADSLDFSIKSIYSIQRGLDKQLASKDRMDLFNPYYKLLYAYMGEILRRSKNGKWKFTEENGMITSAEIVDAKGYTYSPERGLSKQFFEGTGKFRVVAYIEAELVHNDMFKQ